MATHSKKDVESLLQRLQERHEALVEIMRGRETKKLTVTGEVPGLLVKAEDIRFAVDDVATALKEIKARLGKG
jgi:phosphoribosyl-dephospho-CoA transferase